MSQEHSSTTPLLEDQNLSGELSLQAFQTPDEVFPRIQIYAEFDQYSVPSGSEVTLVTRILIPAGWHVYSIRKQGNDFPLPTRLETSSKTHLKLGKLRETPPLRHWDDALEKHVYLHREQFLLEQDFLIAVDAAQGIQDLNGYIHFQSCDNRICVPIRQQAFSAALEIFR